MNDEVDDTAGLFTMKFIMMCDDPACFVAVIVGKKNACARRFNHAVVSAAPGNSATMLKC